MTEPVEPRSRRKLLAYVLAVGLTAFILLIQIVFGSKEDEVVRFIPLVLPIVFAGWLGGLEPGLVATGLAVVGADVFLIPPAGTFKANPRDLLDLSVLLVCGAFLSFVCERLQGAQRNLRVANEHLRHRIDEREQVEEALRRSEQHLHLVTESMAVPVTRCRRDLTFAWVNQSYVDWIRRPASEIVDRPIREVLGDAAFERLMPQFRRALSGEVVHYSDRVPYRGLGERWISASYTPTRDASGQVDGWVAAIFDIDDQKKLEERLKDSDRLKDQFLATLAHELRNPLAPIRNAVEVLKSPEMSDEVRAFSREVIGRQVDHMARLLDDLLDVSRITHNRLELRKEPIQAADVVASAVEASRPHFERSGHELVVDVSRDPIPLRGDRVRLTQALLNLLNNAAKYTPAGGRIVLRATSEGDEAVVSVKDTGIGIDAADLPLVFEMFSPVTPHARVSQRGLGIGLSLVRRLVEMHGGRVEARSEGLGKGSEFVVRLPLAEREEAPAAATPSSLRDSMRGPICRILVVDDVKDSADSLTLMLRVLGHDVATAYDGASAVVLAVSFRPDVALLDIGLPDLDGYEVARRIRASPHGADVAFVAVTGWGQDENRRRSEESKFRRHLVKPLDKELLMKVLAEIAPKQCRAHEAGVG